MSGDFIEFQGDEIARKIPMLGQVVQEVKEASKILDDLMAHNWAEGATDEASQAAWAMYRSIIGEGVVPVAKALMSALGAHEDGLELFTAIGNTTEDLNTARPGFGGAHKA